MSRANARELAFKTIYSKFFNAEPEEDEKIFYGIFDFGGGTTDFDFGIWRQPTEDEEDDFDYVIEHFGASGDRTLGGENLLNNCYVK